MEQQIGATVVWFRREEHAEWEYGIAVSEVPGDSDISVIIDMNRRTVPIPIWDYKLRNYEGCFIFRHK